MYLKILLLSKLIKYTKTKMKTGKGKTKIN